MHCPLSKELMTQGYVTFKTSLDSDFFNSLASDFRKSMETSGDWEQTRKYVKTLIRQEAITGMQGRFIGQKSCKKFSIVITEKLVMLLFSGMHG